MAGLKVDFGQLIAYLVPGALMLYGLSPVFPELASLLQSGDTKNAVITGFVVAALSIVAGMGISIIRFATVDRTFSLDLKGSNFERYPHHRGIPHVDIDYSRLLKDGALNVFLEAKASEKRPYQFYGNVLVVVLAVSLIRLIGQGVGRNTDVGTAAIWVGLIVAATVILYPAARRSYFRYIVALRQLNG